MSVEWETDWRPRQDARTRHKQFTGFDDDGNGDELLIAIKDAGGDVHGKDGSIVFRNRDGNDVTWADPGDWIIQGTQGEWYAVTPEVHQDKYERGGS